MLEYILNNYYSYYRSTKLSPKQSKEKGLAIISPACVQKYSKHSEVRCSILRKFDETNNARTFEVDKVHSLYASGSMCFLA
ncbi:unnamed protein product [Schistosoma curassoni]|uniref:Uncharacterized protein n=1 Tax=Schistosoma curassoni TaxID=6186 RepID=A0A183JWP3_9TREM|nr:unnamed protein product [Schistosoma curassoni]